MRRIKPILKYPYPRFFSRSFVSLLQVFILLCLSWLSWNILHKPQNVPEQAYPYLSTLSSTLVLECQKEGEGISSKGWADLLSILSTVPSGQAEFLILQIRQGIPFEKISWQVGKQSLSTNQIRQIKERRNYLIRYPLYEPKRYAFPVEGNPWYEDTWGADREGGTRRHEGTDLFAAEGTSLFSVSSGKIEQLGWNRLGGERVGVRGDDGNYYYYAHLKSIEPSLGKGQRIAKGTKVGTMGHTGDALTTPDHLHFGIELPNGTWVNPYPFLYVWQHQP